MNVKTIITVLIILLAGPSWAKDKKEEPGDAEKIEKKVEKFCESIKAGKIDAGLKDLIGNSVLKQKILEDKKAKSRLVSRFTDMEKRYGALEEIDLVSEKKVGRLIKRTYLFYYAEYPVTIELVFYLASKGVKVVDLRCFDYIRGLVHRVEE